FRDPLVAQHRLHGARGLVPTAAGRGRRHDRVICSGRHRHRADEGRCQEYAHAYSSLPTSARCSAGPVGGKLTRGSSLVLLLSDTGKYRVEGTYEGRIEIAHRHRQAEIDEAGDAMPPDAAGHDAREMLEVGLDV